MRDDVAARGVLRGILGDCAQTIGMRATPKVASGRSDQTIMRTSTIILNKFFPVAALMLSAVIVTQRSHAAIPLLGPCDPDFRMSGSCSPGTTKEERSTTSAAPAKPAKPAAPAQSVPAPLKAVPAAKSQPDSRPESTVQVSLLAEDNCPKTQRAEPADDAPLVTVTLNMGP